LLINLQRGFQKLTSFPNGPLIVKFCKRVSAVTHQ
jgi:hypothetical protein